MRFDIITLFPSVIEAVVSSSIMKRAQEKGAVSVVTHDLRAFAFDERGTVDDTPYGGGAGMVLRVDVLHNALKHVWSQPDVTEVPREKRCTVILTPQGERWSQNGARTAAQDFDQVTLVCGHYEGFDERIRKYADAQVSIGDFVLTGGELPALMYVDSVARLLEGVIHKESPEEESFSLTDDDGTPLLEYPHYTRPFEYDGDTVPDVLLSGNHGEIRKWRLRQARIRSGK